MVIDLRTLVFVMGISHFLQALVFFQQYKANKNLVGPGWWFLWSVTGSFGFVLVLLRKNVSLLPFVIIIQDPVIILAIIFQYIGIVKFFNKEVNYKLLALFFGLFVFIHVFFYLVIDSIFIRTVTFNVYLSILGFVNAITFIRNSNRSIRSTVNFMIVLMLFHGLIFAYRTVMILFGANYSDLSAITFFNLTQYFNALIVSLLWTFGFIIMLNQKLNFEISELKNQFEQFFHLSPDPVFITRLNDEVFVDCNDSFTTTYGYKKENIVGSTSLHFGLWSNPENRKMFYSNLREKGSFENYETIFQRKDKEQIDVLVSANIVNFNDVPHVICVSRNISERKKIEKEIKDKNEELLRLNSEREKFYSIIAHDLKSPFQGLIGSSEILSEQYNSLSEKEKLSFIQGIKNLSQNSYRLLENLLEWTMLQTGNMSFTPEYFNLLVELHPTLSLLKQTALNKEIELNYEINNMLFISADKNMLFTIIRNLISNSVKFTNRNGKINFTVEKIDNSIKFSISDNGIGIEKDDMEKLFTIDKNHLHMGTNNEKGTGLGLLLCKEMIERHGGNIYVNSEIGKGTTFYFTLPA